ncbi:MAG: 3'-5' exonuclease [Anaerolineaceae bacterium]
MSENTPTSRQHAIEMARQKIAEKPIYLDTETTGLDRSDEIVEISIIDFDGSVLFESLVRPSKAISPAASQVNHITNEMVKSASTWPALWPQVRSILFGRVIGMYNADFDLRMMQQSLTVYRLPWREKFNSFDILTIYSEYRGVWDPIRGSLKWFRLEEAGRQLGITIPNAHRAMQDTLLTRAVLHSIASLPH